MANAVHEYTPASTRSQVLLANANEHLYRVSDSRFSGEIGEALVQQIARDFWLIALVQLNVVAQIALLMGISGWSMYCALQYAALGLIAVCAASLCGLALKQIKQDRSRRVVLSWSALLLMDASLAAVPLVHLNSAQSTDWLYPTTVMVAAAIATVPLSSKLLEPFLLGKAIVMVVLTYAVSQTATESLVFVPAVVVAAIAICSGGYAVHLQSVRSLHLYMELNEARDWLSEQSRMLKSSLDAEQRASRRVEREFQIRERFLRFVSHDLRQPLNALGFLLFDLKSKLKGAEFEDVVSLCQDCVQSADTLIEDVLGASTVVNPSAETRLEASRLQDLLDRIKLQFADSAAAKNLQLVVLQTRCTALTDLRLLERIARNIVANAIRYTDHGKVVVGVKRRGEFCEIVIGDRGPGLSDNAKEKIFTEGYRAGNTCHAANGHGLGMTIARELSDIIGAALLVESKLGFGTTFRIRLKMAPAELQVAPQNSANTPDLTGRRLLVIDDDEVSGNALAKLLLSWNALVETYQRNDEIRKLNEDEIEDADLVFLDYDLGRDLTAFDLIDAWQSFPRERIIIVTGRADVSILRELERNGMCVLSKPAAPDRIAAICSEMIAPSDPC